MASRRFVLGLPVCKLAPDIVVEGHAGIVEVIVLLVSSHLVHQLQGQCGKGVLGRHIAARHSTAHHSAVKNRAIDALLCSRCEPDGSAGRFICAPSRWPLLARDDMQCMHLCCQQTSFPMLLVLMPALCCCMHLLPASRLLLTNRRLCATILDSERKHYLGLCIVPNPHPPKPQTLPPTWCMLLRIHLSLRHSPCQLLLLLKSALASRAHSPLSCTPSSWKRMNFPAFHSLFVKFRLAFTRSRDRLRSCPAAVPVVVGAQEVGGRARGVVAGEQGVGGWGSGASGTGVCPECAVAHATTSQLCSCLQHAHQRQ